MQHGQKKKRGFLLLASENCQGVLLADSSQLSVPMEKIGRLPWVKRTTSLKVLPHFQGSPFPMTDYCGAKGPSSLPPTPNLGPLWRLTLELLKGQLRPLLRTSQLNIALFYPTSSFSLPLMSILRALPIKPSACSSLSQSLIPKEPQNLTCDSSDS